MISGFFDSKALLGTLARVREAIIEVSPELEGTDELRELVAQETVQARRSIVDEKEYFQKKGVNARFANYGHLPNMRSTFQESEKVGWTFSLIDMDRLGLKNVRFLGVGQYEKSEEVRAFLMVFPIPD